MKRSVNISDRLRAQIPALLFAVACSFNIVAQTIDREPLRDNHYSAAQTGPIIVPQSSIESDHVSEPHEPNPLAFRAPTSQGTNSSYVFPTASKRFKRYVSDTIGPWALVGAAGGALVNQWDKSPPEWGQGASGFGKRYASSFGQNAIQQTTSYGLSEALRLDSGFIKSTRHGIGARLADALIQNVTSRTRSGKRVISVPRLSSFYVGGIVPAVTWYPSRFGVKDGFREGNYSLLTGFAVNIVREFIFRK
ncbi:MAG TPA: hypothetical protein VE863_12605 [Pyrinomonadaceae bacterium]|jgi:hypothetical protein|nr:hypothetical protein [Pyrinomonadaceae bacterium]